MRWCERRCARRVEREINSGRGEMGASGKRRAFEFFSFFFVVSVVSVVSVESVR